MNSHAILRNRSFRRLFTLICPALIAGAIILPNTAQADPALPDFVGKYPLKLLIPQNRFMGTLRGKFVVKATGTVVFRGRDIRRYYGKDKKVTRTPIKVKGTLGPQYDATQGYVKYKGQNINLRSFSLVRSFSGFAWKITEGRPEELGQTGIHYKIYLRGLKYPWENNIPKQ
jgi:hypothetical protein